MKCTYKGREISNVYSYGTSYTGLSQMFIMLETAITDSLPSDSNVGRVCWIETDSTNGVLRFRNQFIQIRDASNGISFNTGTNFTYNIDTLDKAQTITGLKTFSTLPESSVVPTTANQLVNKAYVDNNSGGGGGLNINLLECNLYHPIIVDELEEGVYLLIASSGYLTPSIRIKKSNTTDYLQIDNIVDSILYITKDPATLESTGVTFMNCLSINSGTLYQHNIYYTGLSSNGGLGEARGGLENLVTLSNNQTISGKKTFTTLPESSVVPTTDDQLVNKKYVDDNAGGGGSTFDDILVLTLDDTSSEAKAKVSDAITSHNGGFLICIVEGYNNPVLLINPVVINTSTTTYVFAKNNETLAYNSSKSSRSFATIQVTGTWSNNVFTCTTLTYLLKRETDEASYALSVTNTSSYTPTADYHPSTKLYTDKTHYESMTGYDATKTQVLKNVNGTLTWVDE